MSSLISSTLSAIVIYNHSFMKQSADILNYFLRGAGSFALFPIIR